MRFTFDGERVGRKVKNVIFQVSFVKNGDVQGSLGEPLEPQKQVEKVQLANELQSLGYVLDPYAAIEQHGVDKVRYTIKKARAALKGNKGTKSEIHNPGGLIKHLLEVTLSVPEEETQISAEEVFKVTEEVREAYLTEREKAVNEILSRLSKDARDELLETVAAKFSVLSRGILKENKGDRKLYEQIRNTTLIAHGLVVLPIHLNSEVAYFDSLTKTFEPLLRERVRASLNSSV